MALSDWDILAFDIDGPCIGHVTDATGVGLQLYKNWLYVHDKHKQLDGSSPYLDAVVGEVQEGRLQYHRWQIRARRGPQNGIYVVAFSSHYAQDHVEKQFLVGCGVNGYEDLIAKHADNINRLGVDPATVHLVGRGASGGWMIVGYHDNQEVVIVDDLDIPAWTGVLPSSVDYLRSMVTEVITEHSFADEFTWPADALNDLDWTNASRFNQGDNYFAEQLGVTTPTTSPGQADDPAILAMINDVDTTS